MSNWTATGLYLGLRFDQTENTDQWIHYILEDSMTHLVQCTAINTCHLDIQTNSRNCSMYETLAVITSEQVCIILVITELYATVMIFLLWCMAYQAYLLVFVPIRFGMAMIGWYTHRIVFAPVIPGSQSH